MEIVKIYRIAREPFTADLFANILASGERNSLPSQTTYLFSIQERNGNKMESQPIDQNNVFPLRQAGERDSNSPKHAMPGTPAPGSWNKISTFWQKRMKHGDSATEASEPIKHNPLNTLLLTQHPRECEPSVSRSSRNSRLLPWSVPKKENSSRASTHQMDIFPEKNPPICLEIEEAHGGGFGFIHRFRSVNTYRIPFLKTAQKAYAVKTANRFWGRVRPERLEHEANCHMRILQNKGLHPGIVAFKGICDVPFHRENRRGLILDWIEGCQLNLLRLKQAVSFFKNSMRFNAATLQLLPALLRLRLEPALNHMHAAGVAHANLSDENIMIRIDGEPVIIDFDLSHILEEKNENAERNEILKKSDLSAMNNLCKAIERYVGCTPDNLQRILTESDIKEAKEILKAYVVIDDDELWEQ